MAGLPIVALALGAVDVDGTKVEIRGLSRAEAVKLATQLADDVDRAEVLMIAWSTGVTEAEAEAWRAATPAMVVGALVDEIVALSGIDEGAQKRRRP